jgi:hypothetical protein
MPRRALAWSLIAFAVSVVPIALAQGQGNIIGAGSWGRPIAVNNADGSGQVYVTAVPTPADITFQALQVAYTNFKIPTSTIHPDEHMLGTAQWTPPHWLAGHELSRYFDCGSGRGQSADEMTMRLTIQSSVTPDTATHGSVLTTTVAASGSGQDEMARFRPCQSSGQLETRISDEVTKLLKK